MTGAPPDWMDNVPPPDPDAEGRGGGGQVARSDRGRGTQQPAMTAQQTAEAVDGFYEWLTARDTRQQLAMVLPDHVDADVFIATAKTAVLNKPELAREDMRQSLLLAVMKAAAQGLLPDGKQGALVPRYNKEKRCKEVAWQPMVWGVVKLGRETGAIENIRAVIVFHGEDVDIDEVAGTISHKRGAAGRQIVAEAYNALMGRGPDGKITVTPDAFMARIDMAYCVIEPAGGKKPIMRWMPQARIALLRNASSATWGPWSGPFMDEMILKGVIHYTSKWIDLDPSSAPAQRFRAALMTDLDVEFDRQREEPPELPAPDAVPALAAPGPKLDGFEALFAEKEKVPVGVEGDAGAPLDTTSGTQGVDEAQAREPPAPAPTGQGPADGGVTRPVEPPQGAGEPDLRHGSLPPPEGDRPTLDARVAAAIADIRKRTRAQVLKATAGEKYQAFYAELASAGRYDLTEQLQAAVKAVTHG